MNFSFDPYAEEEFVEAVAYLEVRHEGLGLDLAREVFATIQRIILNPEAWPHYTGETRRCLTNRFPYSVIYQIKDDHIVIWALAHSSREPNYWANRVN